MTENEIGHAIIGPAMKVHTLVGPGLLESADESCLAYELDKQHLRIRRQVLVPIRYEELAIDNGYRIDLLVEDLVVVELKALEVISSSGWVQARLLIELQRRAYARRSN
jgi:GxxExxY protein